MKKVLSKVIPLVYGKLFNILAVFNTKGAAKWAFSIFCTIRKGQVLPNQKNFLDGAKFERIEIDGHQVQTYHWPGDGPKVLLMHGWESNTHRWHKLISKLQKRAFDIYAFDAPAHGYSTGKKLHVPLYGEATLHILDKYAPDYVVAHSVGGMTILYTDFINASTSVKKIVTIGSPSEFSQFMDHYQGLLKFNNRVREAMNQHLKDWLGYYFHEFSSSRFVKNNTKQGLLFHDEDDIQVPVAASKQVHQSWKGSVLRLTKGLGHSMHQDGINEQIIDFLSEAHVLKEKVV